jgi:hypothetical protein
MERLFDGTHVSKSRPGAPASVRHNEMWATRHRNWRDEAISRCVGVNLARKLL